MAKNCIPENLGLKKETSQVDSFEYFYAARVIFCPALVVSESVIP